MSQFLYEKHRGSPTLILLNVVGVLYVLYVLHVLHVLHGRIVGLLGLVKIPSILEQAMMQNILHIFVSFSSILIWRYFLSIFFDFLDSKTYECNHQTKNKQNGN